jgi:phosphoserine phosphatase RsbU/P
VVAYRAHQGTLGPGTGLLLYTDGVTEALNPAGEMFGQPRLMTWLAEHVRRPSTAEGLRDELAAELARFRGSATLRDDEAFLILAENAVIRRPAGPAVTARAPQATAPAPLFS